MSTPKLTIANVTVGSSTIAKPLFTTHEGYSGGSHVKGYTITNSHNTHYFSNITIELTEIADVEKDASTGFTFHPEGWSIKLKQTPNNFPPTEEEWSEEFPNTDLNLGQLGSASSADTNTTLYFWVRVFCPGNTDPGFYNSKLNVIYNALLTNNSSNPL